MFFTSFPMLSYTTKKVKTTGSQLTGVQHKKVQLWRRSQPGLLCAFLDRLDLIIVSLCFFRCLDSNPMLQSSVKRKTPDFVFNGGFPSHVVSILWMIKLMNDLIISLGSPVGPMKSHFPGPRMRRWRVKKRCQWVFIAGIVDSHSGYAGPLGRSLKIQYFWGMNRT